MSHDGHLGRVVARAAATVSACLRRHSRVECARGEHREKASMCGGGQRALMLGALQAKQGARLLPLVQASAGVARASCAYVVSRFTIRIENNSKQSKKTYSVSWKYGVSFGSHSVLRKLRIGSSCTWE